MAWDRDFDLLLELKNEPTRAQREVGARRAGLVQERRELVERIDGLRARLAAVEGTYTTEAILNEMLRQGVADMQTARQNLRNWIRQDEDRVKEIDAGLQRLTAEATP
jgi:transposase